MLVERIELLMKIRTLFSEPKVDAFYKWLPKFDGHIARKHSVSEMMPERSLVGLSRQLLQRFMEVREAPIDAARITLYGFACYMLCFKYHVDVDDNVCAASIAVKCSNKEFTNAEYINAEIEVLSTLGYRLTT